MFSGPGLVFVVYPEGIAQMPISPLWSFLFFFMVLTIGLDTQFAMFEAVITGLTDEYPKQLRKYKAVFTGFVCFLCFILGLPMVTQVRFCLLLLFFQFLRGLGSIYAEKRMTNRNLVVKPEKFVTAMS